MTVSLNNVGASAWEVTGVDGDQDVGATGEGNPTLTLQVGTRYTFENGGWSVHPLAFRDSDDSALLSQGGGGSFADDDDVNWVDDGETVAFTLTESLATELDDYVCTIHPSMNGSIETGQAVPPAEIEFSDQSTIGTSVTVDSVRMDSGGFVTIHDDTLQDGQPIESVRGVSEYLDSGEQEGIEIELDSPPLSNGTTLIAMPHRDDPADEQYRFVESGGNEDPPYTAEGDAVIDDADVQVDGAAAVQMSDQQSDGETVTVDFLRIDDGGFLTIHDSRLLDGEPLASVIGVTGPLDPGVYEDVEVTLDEPLEENETLVPMPHRDDPSDGEYRFVESEGDEDPPYLDLEGNAVIDQAEVDVGVDTPDAAITFPDQATASSTFALEEPTEPGVVAQNVSAEVDSAVVVTYEDGDDLVIAGLGTFGAAELDGSDVAIPVDDAGGFPGEHVAHVIPVDRLSGEYAPGDTVSADTADAVAANDAATVHQGQITFDDQSVEGPVEAGDTLAEVDASLTGGDAAYTVDVHVTDDQDGIVPTEWAGSSNVVEGENTGLEIVAERVPEDGEFNAFPIEDGDSYVAMIHVVTDGTAAGTEASPGTFPVLPNASGGDGIVPGGVTAVAEVSVETDDGDDTNGDDDGMDDGGEMDDGDQMDDEDDGDGMDDGDQMDGEDVDDGGDGNESSDDGGPGFGIGAGAAGLGGLAAYALRRLNLDSEPATPEDDGLDDSESDEA